MDHSDASPPPSAFEFTGRWQDFAPIAFTNLLLTIVTLGFYRFWATTRERRYLWAHTRFIDDTLDWTGTGMELFTGFLIVALLLGVPFLFIQFGFQALILRGHGAVAWTLFVLVYVFVFYLIGVARFRALRYRLSRSMWHGIHGGSDDPGFAYGWQYMWRTTVGYAAIGLMIPWSMTRLWNIRWGAMSFGPHPFRARADWGPLMLRYLIFYLSPIALLFGFAVLIIAGGFAVGLSGALERTTPGEGLATALIIGVILFYLLFFVALGLVAMIYYSAFYRQAVGALALGGLQFGFTARTMDWIRLFAGNVALVLVTFGIGIMFLRYRNWRFFIDHLEAYGEIDLAMLTQSRTRPLRQGEGLLDAFDIGAI